MSRPRKVSVAILTWNGRHHLERCLPAVAAQRDPGVPWEVLVLDNGSSDGTAAWVRRHFPGVRLIESPVNLGFCAGNNRLVRAADGDAVALLNNDTRPEPSWLAELVRALAGSPPDVAAVSGLIVDWNRERLDFARGVMTFDGHAFQLDFRRPLAAVEMPPAGAELPFACGGNVLLRRASFLAAGGFDPDYFAYLEDVDLGWRLWAGGERVTFAPEAVVRHRSAGTSELLGLFNRGFLFERNAYLTAYKNYEAGLWERMMPAVLLTLMSRTQALLVGNNPGGELLALDPYAGHIADTAPGAGGPGASEAGGDRAARRESERHARTAAAPPGGEPAGGDLMLAELRRNWRQLGPREFVRRGLRKALSLLSGAPAAAAVPTLTDPRSVAQLRALSYLLGHLDRAAEARRAVQARRRRSDREIFERFPLYLVPTYPGDDELFARPGFRCWLPDDVPLRRRRLDEVMELGEG